MVTLYNHQCTKDAVRKAIKTAGWLPKTFETHLLIFEGVPNVIEHCVTNLRKGLAGAMGARECVSQG